jgi:hypothetical protein
MIYTIEPIDNGYVVHTEDGSWHLPDLKELLRYLREALK